MRKRNPRRNPGGLATLAWAAGSAAVAGIATYYTLREVFVAQIIDQCDVFRLQQQAVAAQTGMQGGAPGTPLTKERARAWF